jgi:predicted SAM-dependent methyltransferase
MLSKIFIDKGFKVKVIEYFDENGIFHYQDWNSEDGFISRSKYNDKRNVNGKISYSSTIVDAINFKY